MQVGTLQLDRPVEYAADETEREENLHPAQVEIAADPGALYSQATGIDLLTAPPAQLTDQASLDDEFFAVPRPQDPPCRAGP